MKIKQTIARSLSDSFPHEFPGNEALRLAACEHAVDVVPAPKSRDPESSYQYLLALKKARDSFRAASS